MTKKTWIIFAVICIGIVGGLVYLSNGNKVDVSDVDEWKVQAKKAAISPTKYTAKKTPR